MASSNKSFTIDSRTYGKMKVTVPADTYNEVRQYAWHIDNPGQGRGLRARTRLSDGSRVNLQNLIYGNDNRLVANDGNFLNCSEKNIFALGDTE